MSRWAAAAASAACVAGLLALFVPAAAGVAAQAWPNVHLVDAVVDGARGETRALFRGAELARNGTAQLPTFLQQMRAAAAAAGLAWPRRDADVWVRDVSLVNVFGDEDRTELELERAFWAAGGAGAGRGELVWWQTIGEPIATGGAWANLSAYPRLRDFAAATAETWMADRVVQRTEQLREWVEAPSGGSRTIAADADAAAAAAAAAGGAAADVGVDKAVVTLIHCIGGKDRTGEMAGAYELRWKGKTWEQVLQQAYAFAGRPIGRGNQAALQWYCFHLRETQPAHFGHLKCEIWNPDKPRVRASARVALE